MHCMTRAIKRLPPEAIANSTMPLITKNVQSEGFQEAPAVNFISVDSLAGNTEPGDLHVELEVETDVNILRKDLNRISIVKIPFDKFTDGRGYSLARQLRELGFAGRIRASGHVHSDQFAFILQSGFDEVEIDDAMAKRQPVNFWQEAAIVDYGYRNKLAQRSAGN